MTAFPHVRFSSRPASPMCVPSTLVGWLLLSERFDDAGYSGATTERPALQRLLALVRARKVDQVVVGAGRLPEAGRRVVTRFRRRRLRIPWR
jgi:hypothetical protein